MALRGCFMKDVFIILVHCKTVAVLVMSCLVTAVFCLLVARTACQRFPDGFQFGVATAAYQIEGAWNVSDKTSSLWDEFTHSSPHKILDGATGDVACDSYHKWRDDINMLKDLGVNFYRFSISWPRLLPTGFPNRVSEDGYRYYSELIDELLRLGIEPYVTLYHWDMPFRMHQMGAWTNPLMVDWFASYARVVFALFGSRVRTWLTINEPLLICDLPAHGWGPAGMDPEVGLHLCTRHVLLAHAKAWRIYDEEFRPKQHGKVSIANQLLWFEPDQPGDEELTELARDYALGRYSHPIYSKEGGWPPNVEQYMAKKSEQEGYTVSRLPPFTQEEIKLIRGTYDFYALNHYTSQTVRPARPDEELGLRLIFDIPELRVATGKRPEWHVAENGWLQVYPEGLRKTLCWLKHRYGDLDIRITESGYSTTSRALEDDDRLQYYRDYMKQMLLAITEDKVNVTAFTAWSLMDNFEWIDGYKIKFGMYDVDFSEPHRPRTPRKSALFYRDVIRTRRLDVPDPQLRDEL